MAEEHAGLIGDFVEAQLVECAPPPAPVSVPLPEAPDRSPAQQAREATIEQTGADPPPARQAVAPTLPTEVARHG